MSGVKGMFLFVKPFECCFPTVFEAAEISGVPPDLLRPLAAVVGVEREVVVRFGRFLGCQGERLPVRQRMSSVSPQLP